MRRWVKSSHLRIACDNVILESHINKKGWQMEKGLFSGNLQNGVKVELVEASSNFSGNTEVALKMGGEIVNVVSVSGKRRGDRVECKTVTTNVVKFNKPATEESPPEVKPRVAPTLSDVVPTR